jgi:hypothetical protein
LLFDVPYMNARLKTISLIERTGYM